MKHKRLAVTQLAKRPYLSLLLLISALPFLLQLPINNDAIWQIWLGRKILHGARLYTDVIEVNPPLWFWSSVPIAGLAETLGLSARAAVILFFTAAIGLSVFLTPVTYRLPLLGVLIVVPMQAFGQREHFTLIAAAPYVFVTAARSRGEVPQHPVAAGLFAAFGLCLKPYFLLLPVALEWLVWRNKGIRPEAIAIAVFVAIYVVAIALITPAYVTDMLPMIRKFYGDFAEKSSYGSLILAFALSMGGAWLGRRKGSAQSHALLTASLAFVPAVLIQGRGFAYHQIPVRGFLCLAIVVELMDSRRNVIGDSMLFAAAILCSAPFGVYQNPFRAEIERHLVGVPRGTSIIALSLNPSVGWPMVEEHGLDWQLNEYSIWQATAVLHPQLLPEARRILSSDFAKRPDILIIDRRRFLAPAIRALTPAGYLHCYALRVRTARFDSYGRIC